MKISYYKTENIALKDLYEFQGELKELSEVNFNKLWKSICDSGFSEPFVVWNCEEDKKIYVLGGNQRLRVLTEKKKLGEKLPAKFPCNFIKCESKIAAKKLLLALASQYGRVTDEGLYEFIVENKFEPDFLKENFEFPGLNLDIFIEGFFEDNIVTNNNPQEEWKDMPEFNQKEFEAYKTLIVRFSNKENYKDFSKLIKQNLTEDTKSIWYPERPEEITDQLGKDLVYSNES